MVPDVAVVFKLDSRELTCHYRKVPMSAWGELKRALNYTPLTLMTALGDWDLDAIAALVWLERTQRERKLAFRDVRDEVLSGGHEWEPVDVIREGKTSTGEPVEPEADPTTGSST